jgi:hypothetical protein
MSNRVRWFGEPWPSEEKRAPVCSSDENRIEIPIGEHCERCEHSILPVHQGLRVRAATGHRRPRYVYYHAPCMLANVLGRELAEQIWRDAVRSA